MNSVLEYLKRNHGVSWSVATLRRVVAGLSEGMEPHYHDASVAQVLKWLEQAHVSRGSRKPVLAVGRDGLMLPIRGEACYREGATATVSVHDRKGRRLGTVYLGQMPEPGQKTLSRAPSAWPTARAPGPATASWTSAARMRLMIQITAAVPAGNRAVSPTAPGA